MVRELLNGALANTAFCVFDPKGEKRLSRTGRGPAMGLSSKRGPNRRTGDDAVIEKMHEIASKYKPTGEDSETILQDFHSFRQALNVASADQRLLVFVNAEEKEARKVSSELQNVFSDEDIVGKFHLNFLNQSKDKNWSKAIKGASKKEGIAIIKAGTFGLEGQLVELLPLSNDAKKIKTALLAANEKFAANEKRKNYSSHVRAGKRKGVFFENEIPYGEDRDGDGKIDRENRSNKRGRSRGKG